MPPRGSAPSSGGDLHPGSLERPLLQLKLKVAALKKGVPSQPFRELRKVSEEFESLLPAYEAGLPGLQLVLAQASHKDAQRIMDCAGTLTDKCVSLIGALISKGSLDPDLIWNVLRPILRLLLWLVPEHVPSSETLAALTTQSVLQQVASTRTKQAAGPKQGDAAAIPDAEDRGTTLAHAYISAVATVPLATVLCQAIACQLDVSEAEEGADITPRSQRDVEQAFFWVALFYRLRTLAYEMSLNAGGPGGPVQVPSQDVLRKLPFSPSSMPFFDFVWYILAAPFACTLTIFTEYLFQYLRGVCENAKSAALSKLNVRQSRSAAVEGWLRTARAYKPSEALLSSVGAWGSTMTLMKRNASLAMFWPTRALMVAKFSSGPSYLMGSASRQFVATAATFGGCKSFVDELGESFPVPADLLEEHVRGYMLMLRERLSFEGCMVQDWKDAAHLIMVVVQSCMRNNLMHHAGACYSQSDLTKHLLLLPPKYTTPRESALLMLLHRNYIQVAAALRQGYPIQDTATPEGLQQWSRTAAVIAQLVQLLLQSFSRNAVNIARCREGGVQESAKHLLETTTELMQYLRPPRVLDFTVGGHYSQGWATCFATVGDLMSLLVGERAPSGDVEKRCAEDATAFRALLAPSLPLLTYTAAGFESAHQQTTQSDISQPQLVQDQLHPSSTSQQGVACQAVTDLFPPTSLPLSQPVHQPSSPSAVGGEAETAAPPPATSVGVAPADSALLLLMGASAVVERCVAVGLVSAAAHNIISGSSVVAAGSQGQPSSSASQSFSSGTSTAGTQAGLTIAQQSSGDDLMAAFNALLSLARLLVSDGPWWEEARAKYSLLLIEALFKVGTELGSIVEEVVAAARDAACEPVRQALLAVMAGPGDAPAPPAQLSITDLVVHLFMRLWSLLHDPLIVGQSERPAAWLPKIKTYMDRSINSSVSMMVAIDGAIASAVACELSHLPADVMLSLSSQRPQESRGNEQHGSDTTATAAGAGAEAVAAQASSLAPGTLQPPLKVDASRVAYVEFAVHQLAPLLPRVPWAQIHASLPKGSSPNLYPTIPDGLSVVLELQHALCGGPLLRMVCLLALCGRLGPTQMEQLRQMLGGGTDPGSSSLDTSGGSSPSNSGPWQEPSSLAAPGPQRTEALQQLAQLVVLEQVRGTNTQAQWFSCASQVHAIFTSSGLAHLADLHEKRCEDGELTKMCKLYKRWYYNSADGELEAYLAWLQRGFLQIITTSLQQ